MGNTEYNLCMASENPWRDEFERDGEQQVFDNTKQGAIYNDPRKHRAAIDWLGEKARERRDREEKTL